MTHPVCYDANSSTKVKDVWTGAAIAMKSPGRYLLSCLLLLLASASSWADLVATVDRARLGMGDSFTLTITATDGEPLEQIDQDLLDKHFIISTVNSGRNMSFDSSSGTRYSEYLNIVLFPRKSGPLEIPSFTAGGASTERIFIVVDKAGASPDSSRSIFVEAEVDRSEVYVQAQLIYTFRLYLATSLDGRPQLQPLAIDGVEIHELGARNYQERRDGVTYQVAELRYALQAQNSGELTIPSLTLEARESSGSGNFYRLGRRGKLIRRETDEITIRVKPIPASFPDSQWIPASQLEISQSWSSDPEALEVGDSATRTISIMAEGASGNQLPALQPVEIDGIRLYAEQPELETVTRDEGIVGIGKLTSALLVTQAGQFELPPIRIPWWDVEADQLRYAELPAHSLSIAATQLPSVTAATSPRAGEIVRSDIAPGALPGGDPLTMWSAGFWPWTTLLAVAGWLATLLYFLWWARRNDSSPEPGDSRQSEKALFSKLLKACGDSDAETSRQLARLWGQALLQKSRVPSLTDLAQSSGDPALQREFAVLDQQLYGDNRASWSGDQLAIALKQWRRQIGDTKKGGQGSALPTLNPAR